ncbi:ATP-binding protein [Kitasatospora sp. NPDC091257]|uniref:ATP-binding protein n=1 Tax=Kitasatospora sp. NPDC091257 TaxID=3364084 RepID=UPI0038023EE8
MNPDRRETIFNSPIIAATSDEDATEMSYLLARLHVVEQRVRRALFERLRTSPEGTGNPYRGLYVTEQTIIRLLGASPTFDLDSHHDGEDEEPIGDGLTNEIKRSLATANAMANRIEASGVHVRIRGLAKNCRLSALDTELLLIAFAPEIDPRFGRFYGYLHDDISRRWASVGLALELCGATLMGAEFRTRLSPGSPLLDYKLLTIEDDDQPLLARSLRLEERVVGHLLGDDRLDNRLHGIARCLTCPNLPVGTQAKAEADRLAALLIPSTIDGRLVYLRGTPDSPVTEVAATITTAVARDRGNTGEVVIVDLSKVPAPVDIQLVLDSAAREARLRGTGLVIGPLERLPVAAAERAEVLRDLNDLAMPVVLTGSSTWDARWSDPMPLVAALAPSGQHDYSQWWKAELGEPHGTLADSTALSLYRLAPHQIRTTVTAASAQAAFEQNPLMVNQLCRTARLHNSADLERLACRIEPSATWDDLVLADLPKQQLHELADRIRHRDTVLSDWRLRPAHGRGRKVVALFTGESGTGKTLAAEVLASGTGVDLYVVNLATVVDKYIGETEKNLERIFTAAAEVRGMLFFDEADALFGTRSPISDAHDRYANIEAAYLLQRLETFDGIAVLATNLRGNVDQAFLRRLDGIIHFPSPGVAERSKLWDLCLGSAPPRDLDLDLQLVASAFELTGGNIRSCALTAAYRSARTGHPITTSDLFAAVEAEYRKMGRLVDESQFGER